MRNKQLTLFATKEDIISIMKQIEEKFSIEYIEMGIFNINKTVRYSSLESIPNIGYTNVGNWISDNRFMIVNKESEIIVREVPQRKGGVKYAVDMMKNPMSVELSTGGIYTKKENVLIAGRLGIVYENNFSNQLYKAISTEIKRVFKRIETCYVGNEAEAKLISRWRLVTGEKSPKEYDLSLP